MQGAHSVFFAFVSLNIPYHLWPILSTRYTSTTVDRAGARRARFPPVFHSFESPASKQPGFSHIPDVCTSCGQTVAILSVIRAYADSRLASEVAGQGERLDALRNDMELHGRETRRELRELPAQLLAAVMAGIKRSAYATDLRALQAEVAELKTDVAELKRAAGE